MLGNALEVAKCGCFGFQMPERVDGVKGCVKRLIELEIGHVLLGQHRPATDLLEFLLTKIQRRLVQIHSGYRVTATGHFTDQTARTATGLEHPFDRERNELAEHVLQEPRFARSLFEKPGLVPLGMIVPVNRLAVGLDGWFGAVARFQNKGLRRWKQGGKS